MIHLDDELIVVLFSTQDFQSEPSSSTVCAESDLVFRFKGVGLVMKRLYLASETICFPGGGSLRQRDLPAASRPERQARRTFSWSRQVSVRPRVDPSSMYFFAVIARRVSASQTPCRSFAAKEAPSHWRGILLPRRVCGVCECGPPCLGDLW